MDATAWATWGRLAESDQGARAARYCQRARLSVRLSVPPEKEPKSGDAVRGGERGRDARTEGVMARCQRPKDSNFV